MELDIILMLLIGVPLTVAGVWNCFVDDGGPGFRLDRFWS